MEKFNVYVSLIFMRCKKYLKELQKMISVYITVAQYQDLFLYSLSHEN